MTYSKIGIHTIKSVTNSGKTLILDDLTMWEISIYDSFTTMFWMRFDQVVVKPYMGSNYKLEKRILTGKIVEVVAKFLG